MSLSINIGRPFLNDKTLDEQARSILRLYGTDAHVYLPGASGVAVSGLPTNNYTLSDGSTGYSAVDGTAGLVLDAAGSVGAELSPDPTFDAPGTWTVSGGWSVVGGKAVSDGTGAGQIYTDMGIALGKTYLIEGVISGMTLGACTPQVGTWNDGPALTQNGAFSLYVRCAHASTNANMAFAADATFNGAIDYCSVREVTGIHATQATTSNKCAVRQTAGRYRWEFDSTDLLTATYPAGYEAATIIDAKSTGHVTTQNQNIVGSYSMGPSATLYGRIVLKTSPTAAELTVLQRFANMLSGAS